MEVTLSYDDLLKRLKSSQTIMEPKAKVARLELPKPDVFWVGKKTIFRNFMDFSRLIRRNPNHLLMFLAKELATAVSLDGDRAIFIGRKVPQSFSVLINRYMKDFVNCPVCGSPDTHLEKVRRLQFLVCEACGAKSPTKSK
ncbi:MAG: translation initiation factor IF-2 subunit beta [archaeon]|nr:translation initiation factor IF-2 subunit beta [archaeon]MCP8315692.1 translation initiation factor IF-2 subunit beta [archaeon]